MARPVRSIDFEEITFPSDGISFREIRKVEAGLLGGHDPGGRLLAELEVVPAHLLERILASKAFAAALGQADPFPDDDRLVLILTLNDTYCRYGISSGLQQSRQLVRRLEADAMAQAKASRTR